MKYEKTQRINANASKVFNVAGDVAKLDKWIPRRLHSKLIDNESSSFTLAEYARPDQEKRRLTWNDGNTPGYKGWVQVNEAGNASEVTIHVEAPAHSVAETEVDKYLLQALEGLQKQVTTGSAS